MQDISLLPPPDIVEILEYEEIVSRMKAELVVRDPSFTALIESDPAMKVLEVAAWRELLLRQRINEAGRANLLAFAKGSDLDHLAAFYGIERLLEESDTRLTQRIREKILGWSTAGSSHHYRFHALSADVAVRDVRADSPEMGLVRIAVLSHEGDGIPSEELLTKVRDKVTAEDVRVLTDTVEVVACDIIPIDITAELYLYPDGQSVVIALLRKRFITLMDKMRSLGWDVTLSWINAHLFTEGIQRVEITQPLADIHVSANSCVALRHLTLQEKGRDW